MKPSVAVSIMTSRLVPMSEVGTTVEVVGCELKTVQPFVQVPTDVS